MTDELKKETEGGIPPVAVRETVAYLNADPEVPHNELEPESLLDFKVYNDKVVVIIATGQKYTVSLADLRAGIKAKLARLKSK